MSDSIYGARIAIYNKPLCEVLDRYKEQGTFEKSKAGSYRHQVVIADTDEEKHVSLSYYFRDGSGAFSVTEVPKHLRDVTACLLICLYREFDIPKAMFLSLKDELMGRLSELELQYDYVNWEASYAPVGGDYDPASGLLRRVRTFTYNRFSDVSDYTEELRCSGFLDDKYYGTRGPGAYDDYDWDALVRDDPLPEVPASPDDPLLFE